MTIKCFVILLCTNGGTRLHSSVVLKVAAFALASFSDVTAVQPCEVVGWNKPRISHTKYNLEPIPLAAFSDVIRLPLQI